MNCHCRLRSSLSDVLCTPSFHIQSQERERERERETWKERNEWYVVFPYLHKQFKWCIAAVGKIRFVATFVFSGLSQQFPVGSKQRFEVLFRSSCLVLEQYRFCHFWCDRSRIKQNGKRQGTFCLVPQTQLSGLVEQNCVTQENIDAWTPIWQNIHSCACLRQLRNHSNVLSCWPQRPVRGIIRESCKVRFIPLTFNPCSTPFHHLSGRYLPDDSMILLAFPPRCWGRVSFVVHVRHPTFNSSSVPTVHILPQLFSSRLSIPNRIQWKGQQKQWLPIHSAFVSW